MGRWSNGIIYQCSGGMHGAVGVRERRRKEGRFRTSHLLPFWKNSLSLSLNGCRYSFGDSLHTTAICFSLAVKRRWQLDFLENTGLLNLCSMLCTWVLIVQNPYASSIIVYPSYRGKSRNKQIISSLYTFLQEQGNASPSRFFFFF